MPDDSARGRPQLLRPRLLRICRPAGHGLANCDRRDPMTNPSTESLFRQAAEAEGGMTVLAGGRIAHVNLALESGRAITIDLSQVSENLRASLVGVIREIVRLTTERSPKAAISPFPGSSISPRPS